MTTLEKFSMAAMMGRAAGGIGRAIGRGAGTAGRMGMGAAKAIGPRGLAVGGGLGALGAGGIYMANAMSKKPTGPAGIFQDRNQQLEDIYNFSGQPAVKRSSFSFVVSLAQRLSNRG